MAIVITCECGRKLRGGDELAGRTVRCPACGATVTAPGGEAGGDGDEYELEVAAAQGTPPTAARRQAMARPAALSDEEERPQPSARRMRVIAAAMVVTVLLAVGGVIWGVIHLATAPLPPAPKTPQTGGGYLDMLSQAKQKAKGLGASSNMRQLIQVMLLQKAGTGRWPDRLEELRDELGPTYDALMTNPRTGENPGFIYVKPKRGAGSEDPILFEALDGQPDPEGAKGFADGHVEPGTPR